MSSDLFVALRRVLSADRIDGYRRRATDTDLDLLECYFWNMALCEALYPALQALEVTLRNNISDAASQLYHTPAWLIRQPPVLHLPEQAQVATALDRIRRAGHAPTPGRIVAELNFGFWTSLLDRRYEHRQRLWPQLLRDVFPNLPRRHRTRHIVSVRMSAIRHLRNRVFHHEPIWHWLHLEQQQRDLVGAIHWLDQAMGDAIILFDRFPTVHARGSSPYRRDIDRLRRTWL